MSQLSTVQRTAIVNFYLRTGSIISTQRLFHKHFKGQGTPTNKTIQRLTEKFLAQGSVNNQNTGKSGRKKQSRSVHNVQKVAERVSRTPQVSVRRLASQVGLSAASTWRILKTDLGLSPYKVTVCQ